MKKALIISPYFAPVNAADMQRVRMSLPYFSDFGWEVEVVSVAEQYTDMNRDELLRQTIPAHIKLYQVKAFEKRLTSKFGLGSIALRSFWFYRIKVNQLLRAQKYDLIYFSTTQFPVCNLGPYWKKKFAIPYVIDMQDPWHSDYYRDKPRAQRPKKYWFSYYLNKYLEPRAISSVDGLISVSAAYIINLKNRYPSIKKIPAATITFGAFEKDIEIARANQDQFAPLLEPDRINIVYVGRGGADMLGAVTMLFESIKRGIESHPSLYKRVMCYFIGTSYAPSGKGEATILPLARKLGIDHHVFELTERISFYHTLNILSQATALFVPGSDDPQYTASKIYPYLATKRPLLAILHPDSPAFEVLKEYGAEHCYTFENITDGDIDNFMSAISGDHQTVYYAPAAVEKYSAREMTKKQCLLFNNVLESRSKCPSYLSNNASANDHSVR